MVRKNICPVVQVDGIAFPVCNGFVLAAEEKSTFLLCVFRSTAVCPSATITHGTHNISKAWLFRCLITTQLLCPSGHVKLTGTAPGRLLYHIDLPGLK
jgi:hypothetical protein